ncbi:MAG: ParA family protein [Proteobacteria bacterium]|nr:ParA family protein [Pseudomonadota bacterium]
MKTIVIYSNKGGVGKSTLTLFLADFYSSTIIAGKKAKILVMDLDGQCSVATSLLGIDRATEARVEKRSLSDLMLEVKAAKRANLSPFIFMRNQGRTPTRKIPLGALWVMLTERERAVQFESGSTQQTCNHIMQSLLKKIENRFDLVLMDLPANLDQRHKIALAGLSCADQIIIPTEPTRITMNAMNDTMDLIYHVKDFVKGQEKAPQIAGILLNKTDKRSRQYHGHHKELEAFANKHKIQLFKSFLPHSNSLSRAADDSLNFEVLRDRYNANYDKVRAVSRELAIKCGYDFKKE